MKQHSNKTILFLDNIKKIFLVESYLAHNIMYYFIEFGIPYLVWFQHLTSFS